MATVTQPNSGFKRNHPEINPAAVELILRSNPAASAYRVAVGNVWIWIHGAIISKRGQRRRVLEAFLDAPNHRLTSADLAPIANQYTPRILELRAAGFPIPNLPYRDGSTYYQLMITEAQVSEIRAALAVADVLKPQRSQHEPPKPIEVVPPPSNAAGQFGFGFEPAIPSSSFLDIERGVQK